MAHKNGALQTSLNSDKVDGYDAGNSSGNIPVSNGTVNTNLNADMADGIQGNQIPLKTTADITYYVDATNGNDSNNGLTSATAFKTIQYAVNRLPQIINHVVTINVGAGTYSEDVGIRGFSGKGSISLLGDTVVSATRTVNSITISSTNLLGCKIRGFNAITASSWAIVVLCSINVIVDYCQCISSSTSIGCYFDNSFGSISNSTISNRVQAIYTTNCSTVFSNTTGLLAVNASTIGKSSTQPTGTTAEANGAGGVIR